jgi:hypothetical protein
MKLNPLTKAAVIGLGAAGAAGAAYVLVQKRKEAASEEAIKPAPRRSAEAGTFFKDANRTWIDFEFRDTINAEGVR